MLRKLGMLVLLLLWNVPLTAQTIASPNAINFQGRLTKPDGTPVGDGTYSVRFSLWTAASGGTEKWNQTLVPVTVRQGTFAVLLSGFAAGTFDTSLFLEIKIGNDAPLIPRLSLVSVPYAMKANTVPDGSITSAKLSASFLAAGGDLIGTFPNPLLATKATSLSKVSGGVMTSDGTNIGINNLFPEFSLDVYRALDGNIASFRSPDTFGTIVALRNSSVGGTNFSLISTGTNHPLGASNLVVRDVGRSVDRFVLDINGNLGIGATLPNAKLDVKGEMLSDSLSLYDPLHQGTVQLAAYSYGAGDRLDQNTMGATNINYVRIPSGWQSFTAGVTASCTAIEVMVYTRDQSRGTASAHSTLRLYSGEGVTGMLLSTASVSLSVSGGGNRIVRINLPSSVPLTSGQKYTFALDQFTGMDSVTINYTITDIYAGGRTSIGAINDFLFRTYYDSGDLRYGLDVSGTVRANGVTLTSDSRFKTNIATFANALDTISNLHGVVYDWDRTRWPERGFPQGKQIGFLAQEVERVLPELVSTDSSGYKSVAYANVVPILVEAIKTLKTKHESEISVLKKDADAQKQQNAELKARLEVLEQAVQRLMAQPR